jgi:hypothetical protein
MIVRCWLWCLLACSFCVCAAQSTMGDDSLNPCSVFKEGSTELLLLGPIITCADAEARSAPDSCKAVVNCLAEKLVNLTTSFPCDQTNGRCEYASGAFILVETLRRFLASSIRDTAVSCDRHAALRQMVVVCAPNESPNGLLAGYDLLVRAVSKRIGELEPIASDLHAMKMSKLWQGALGLGVTFAVPGVLAVSSSAHVLLVFKMQVAAAVVIFVYVYKQHGCRFAIGALSLCIVTLAVELIAIVLLNRNSAHEQHRLDQAAQQRRPMPLTDSESDHND